MAFLKPKQLYVFSILPSYHLGTTEETHLTHPGGAIKPAHCRHKKIQGAGENNMKDKGSKGSLEAPCAFTTHMPIPTHTHQR